MPRLTKAKGFVLKKISLLNKDVIFTIFTEEEGKMSITAKGIKKITSRRAPHIQTGNFVELELYSRNDRFYLSNSNLISAFSQIKENEKKVHYLYFFFFILDRFLPEHQKEHALYNITQAFLFDMARNENFTKEDLTVHTNNLLSQAGYTTTGKTLSELTRTIEEVINEKVPKI